MAILVPKKLCTLPARRRVTARPKARPPDDRPAKAGHHRLGHVRGRPAMGMARRSRTLPIRRWSHVARRNDLDVLDYKYLSFELEFERIVFF
jgi:hypothetical protein